MIFKGNTLGLPSKFAPANGSFALVGHDWIAPSVSIEIPSGRVESIIRVSGGTFALTGTATPLVVDLVVRADSQLEDMKGFQLSHVRSLTLASSARVDMAEAFVVSGLDNCTLEADATLEARSILLEAVDVTLAASGAAIHADGRGFAAGQGSGAGCLPYSHTQGWGASHGGKGGNGYGSTCTTQITYGNRAAPITMGSGAVSGGSGGGAIKLVVSDTLTLKSGSRISANGNGHSRYGGGAGGSVWLRATVINAATDSTIAATGGNGGSCSRCWLSNGYRTFTSGGGSGGRILVELGASVGAFSPIVQLQGGSGVSAKGGSFKVVGLLTKTVQVNILQVSTLLLLSSFELDNIRGVSLLSSSTVTLTATMTLEGLVETNVGDAAVIETVASIALESGHTTLDSNARITAETEIDVQTHTLTTANSVVVEAAAVTIAATNAVIGVNSQIRTDRHASSNAGGVLDMEVNQTLTLGAGARLSSDGDSGKGGSVRVSATTLAAAPTAVFSALGGRGSGAQGKIGATLTSPTQSQAVHVSPTVTCRHCHCQHLPTPPPLYYRHHPTNTPPLPPRT